MNMKMLAVFGQLLQSASEKLKKWDESSGKTDTGQGSTTSKIEATKPKTLIWDVMDGPYHVDDFPEDDLQYMGIEDDYEWMIVCKIEENGKMGLANFWYQTLDEALQIKYYFDNNIEPLEIDNEM
jgi:hypothetical protein